MIQRRPWPTILSALLLAACSITPAAALAGPAWTTTAPMPAALAAQSALALPGGTALLAGGQDATPALFPSTFLYDPGTASWTSSAPMSETHYSGFLAVLGTGDVLMAGGLVASGAAESATAELYHGGAWSPSGAMVTAQLGTGVLLPSGKVLITGGILADKTTRTAIAQIYDPGAQTWAAAASMSTPRWQHTATVLASGKVLVTGGEDAGTTIQASAEIYDPALDQWSLTAAMHSPRWGHAATLLAGGTVLVSGGIDTSGGFGMPTLASVEIYDPAAGTWSLGPPLATARSGHAAVRLADGTVLVVSGSGPNEGDYTAEAERFDPASMAWLSAGANLTARINPAVAPLADGSVLVAGGFVVVPPYVTASVELFKLVPQGGACTAPGECASRFCVDGVCCDTACTSACHVCAKAMGAAADGTCSALSCASLDDCHPGSCDPATRTCVFPAAADGTPCDDHNLCTEHSFCAGGTCTGAMAVVCAAQDDCHDAACDPATGACFQQQRADGAPCDDHSVCTQHDTCVSGACTGGTPVVCVPQDACHAAGVCDPLTGCTNPVLPSCNPAPPGPTGSAPDGEVCAADAACAHGHCVHGVCCDATCTDRCSSCALPGSRGKCTAEPEGTDLHQDCGAAANCVSTCGAGGVCVGAKQGTQCLPGRCVDAQHGLGPALCPYQGAPCPEGDSVPFDCGYYACQAALGTCAASCRTVADCAPGAVCDATYHCGPPPDVAGGSEGCQHAPGAPVGGGGGALGLLLGLLLAGRRRQRAA